MKRRIVISFSGDEASYVMAINLVMRQLTRGQTRGEGTMGLSAYSYRVETDHSEQKTQDDE